MVEEKKLPEEKESPSRFIYTRKQTGIRILATLFFGILIWGILEIIIVVAVIFQIIYALIAKEPNIWMISFSNRTITYFYRVLRYLVFAQTKCFFLSLDFLKKLKNPNSNKKCENKDLTLLVLSWQVTTSSHLARIDRTK